MEKIEEQELTSGNSASESEAEQVFENEGGVAKGTRLPRLPSETETEGQNIWSWTVSKFRKLKNYSAPVVTKLWKGSREEYAVLKKSLGAAQVAYRSQKKKIGNRN